MKTQKKNEKPDNGYRKPDFRNAEEEQIFKEGCINMNIAFLMCEAAQWLIRDGESALKKVGLKGNVHRELKMRLTDTIRQLKMAKVNVRELGKHIYMLDSEETAVEESDQMARFIKLYFDRVGDDPNKAQQVFSMLFNQFPSVLGLKKFD